MIHKIYLQNFYSFRDKTEIDLTVGGKAPDTSSYFKSASGIRLTKLIAFIGPNASGKTSLLKSLSFLSWFITDSFTDSKPGEEIMFKPFLFSSVDSPSEFKIEFETEKQIYRYELKTTTKRVLWEKLSTKKKKFSTIFEREWNRSKNIYDVKLNTSGLSSDFSKLLRENASIISTARQVNHTESLEVVNYFDHMGSNIAEYGKMPMERHVDALKFYEAFPYLRERAEEILSKFDLGLSKIKIEKIEGPEKQTRYIAWGVHKNTENGKQMLLPLKYESNGTVNLLLLLRIILTAIETGGVAVLDEMDTDLHPYMISEIVNLFSSKTYNPKNAQLLFSTHGVQVLNKLDKQQIILVEKNDKGVSEAWKLSDIQGVRADDNFYAKYMAGAYGAVPRI